MGRSKKIFLETISSKWHAARQQVQDMFQIGSLHVVFWLDRNGKVRDLKVFDNTNNEAFANYCIQSVREAKIPPMPDDLAATLPPEGLLTDQGFALVPNDRITR